MAISVVLAVDPVGDELVRKIVERVERLVVGPGDDPKSEMGPLVTQVHRDKVASYLDLDEGFEIVVDGRKTQVLGGAAAEETPDSGSAPPCSTTSGRAPGCTPRRSSARSCRSCGSPPTRRAWS
nr:hypothetical protein GCM10020093_101000 [Planobispora longispora]